MNQAWSRVRLSLSVSGPLSGPVGSVSIASLRGATKSPGLEIAPADAAKAGVKNETGRALQRAARGREPRARERPLQAEAHLRG